MTTPSGQPRDRRGKYQQHGLHPLKKAVTTLGSRALPSKRSALGRELASWRASLELLLGHRSILTTAPYTAVSTCHICGTTSSTGCS